MVDDRTVIYNSQDITSTSIYNYSERINFVSIPDQTDKSTLQDLEETKRTAVEKVVMTVLYNYYLK